MSANMSLLDLQRHEKTLDRASEALKWRIAELEATGRGEDPDLPGLRARLKEINAAWLRLSDAYEVAFSPEPEMPRENEIAAALAYSARPCLLA